MILKNPRIFQLVVFIFLYVLGNIAVAQNDSIQPLGDTLSPKLNDSIQTAIDTLNLSDSIQPIVDTLNTKLPDLSVLEEDDIEPIDSMMIFYFNSTVENFKNNDFHDIDTSLIQAHQYDPLEVDNGMYSTLSNVGLAYNNLVFNTETRTGYDMEIKTFDKYMFSSEKVKYYKLVIPHSKISYIMGSNKEQNLNINLNREVYKNLTIGFEYALNNSPGPYERSASNNTRVFFTGQYYTPNKRYGVIANYRNNRVRVEESGGIINDSIFEENTEEDRRVIDVNLNDASQRLTVSGFYVEQYFNFLKPKERNDSIKRKIDAGHIAHSLNYVKNQLIYEDANPISDFYLSYAPPLDSSLTFDSIYQSKITNKLMWSSLGYNEDEFSKVFHLYFGAKHDLIQQTLAYDSVRSSYNQISPFGGISLTLFKSMHLTAYAELVFSDYSGGDYKVQADIRQHLGTVDNNIGRIDGGILLLNRKPSWWYENYQSNRFRWTNDFDKETSMLIHGKYTWKELSAGFKFNTFTNYTYLDDSVNPAQLEGAETHLQLFAEGTIPLKKFGINTRLVYQKSSQPGIIRVPEFTGLMNIYFKSSIFKDAAIVQTGFQFFYFSSFYADAYMPEMRAFYLQNEKQIGNYVFADFYLTLNVKRAILFFKMAHINSYLRNYSYYSAPHYPSRDARFYFGVSWRFHY